jgi:hypothetical protein
LEAYLSGHTVGGGIGIADAFLFTSFPLLLIVLVTRLVVTFNGALSTTVANLISMFLVSLDFLLNHHNGGQGFGRVAMTNFDLIRGGTAIFEFFREGTALEKIPFISNGMEETIIIIAKISFIFRWTEEEITKMSFTFQMMEEKLSFISNRMCRRDMEYMTLRYQQINMKG